MCKRIGFIPAQAGRSAVRRSPMAGRRVHPRAGGEIPFGASRQRGGPGSSPRRRGDHGHRHRYPRRLGFIPAQAGRSLRLEAALTWRRVHPRAGGEILCPIGLAPICPGSSPRRRGDQLLGVLDEFRPGFIPAQAGRSGDSWRRCSTTTVHPRAGGEIRLAGAALQGDQGSSPRRRGDRPASSRATRGEGFIPAQAGRSGPASANTGDRRVHPRAGGEIRTAEYFDLNTKGSSPRRRGDLQAVPQQARPGGFIPAQAGRSGRPWPRSIPHWVHPRAGGEIGNDDCAVPRPPGSSPRRRGDPGTTICHLRCSGFIPAQAGRSGTSCTPPPSRWGSSPRRRGDRSGAARQHPDDGFIPAQAGRSSTLALAQAVARVHPRAGGEIGSGTPNGNNSLGSSPRRRGDRIRSTSAPNSDGFIPAQAGRSRGGGRRGCHRQVHPRAGGEISRCHLRGSTGAGSSPRRRGDLRNDPHGYVRRGFIPAQAGRSLGTNPLNIFTISKNEVN